jgi:hypothetical protein
VVDDGRSCLICGYWAPARGRICDACILDRRAARPRHYGDDDGPGDGFDWDAWIATFEATDA